MPAYSEAAALLSAIDEALDKGVWENDVAVNLEHARLMICDIYATVWARYPAVFCSKRVASPLVAERTHGA